MGSEDSCRGGRYSSSPHNYLEKTENWGKKIHWTTVARSLQTGGICGCHGNLPPAAEGVLVWEQGVVLVCTGVGRSWGCDALATGGTGGGGTVDLVVSKLHEMDDDCAAGSVDDLVAFDGVTVEDVAVNDDVAEVADGETGDVAVNDEIVDDVAVVVDGETDVVTDVVVSGDHDAVHTGEEDHCSC